MTFQERAQRLAGVYSPREVAHGAGGWLTDALIPTEFARTRLARWVAAGGPAPDPTAVVLLDTEGVRHIVIEALERIPPPVADHIVRHCIVAAVGRHTSGWVWTLPALPTPAVERGRLVVADARRDDADLGSILAHEWGHAWVSPVLPPDASVPHPRDVEAAEARREALSRDWRVADPRRVRHALEEYRVGALAAEWGFTGIGADVERFSRELHRARATERTDR